MSTKNKIARQIFLKEELYQLLEGKRDRLLNIAAMTLQRYARMFFVRKNFVKFRRRIIALEARCKGFVLRCVVLPGANVWGSLCNLLCHISGAAAAQPAGFY